MMQKLHEEHDAIIRRLHAEGKNWREVGRELGVCESTAFRRGRKLGLTTSMSEARKLAWADPEKRARMLAGRQCPRFPEGMTPKQIEDYRTYRRNRYSVAEALAALGVAP